MVAVIPQSPKPSSDDSSSPPPSPASPATPPNTPSPSTDPSHQTACKVSVTVPRDAVGFIIGKRGETVRNMMARSRAFIHVDRDDTNPHAPHRIFHIQGEPAAVAAARSLIKEKVYAVLHGKPHARVTDAVVQTNQQSGTSSSDVPPLPEDDEDEARFESPLEMWIPRGCVGMIIGHGGQVINEMQEKAGATIVVHNNKMDRNGAKLLTISGGQAEKLHAKQLIQTILDRAGSRFRYMEHPHDTPHFFTPHPHPHASPPWQYPHNTQVPFYPRQSIPEFVGMHHMSPWVHPLSVPPHNVRPIIQQPQNHQPPQQHLHPHLQQQAFHQQAPSHGFPVQQSHQQTLQQIQQQQQRQQQPQPPQPQLQLPPQIHHQQPPHTQFVPQHHPQQLSQQPSQSNDTSATPNTENQNEQSSQREIHQPPNEYSLTHHQAEAHPSPPLPQQEGYQPGQSPQHRQQSLQALQTQQQQQLRHMQQGAFPNAQISPQVSPIFGQPMLSPPTPVPWNPTHIPYPVPTPMGVPGNNMMANHPMYKMNTKVVCVPSSCVGIIIGRSGETIRDLQRRSGAYIKVTPDRDAGSGDPERLIYICGPPSALELAHSLVNDVINEGLSRNYRDGVEPRAANDTQPFKSASSSAERKGDEQETTPVPGETSKPEPTSTKDKSEPAIPSTSKTEETSSERAELRQSKGPSDIPNADVEPEDKVANSQDPEPAVPTSATSPTSDKPTVPDQTDDWGASQVEGEANVKTESHPNAFAGEGRLVQRPATDYPSASISFEMKIPNAKVGVIIGKKGQTIRSLQQKSGARIVVSKKMDTSREDNPRAVTITGPQPFVDGARRLIVAIINPSADKKGEDGETAVDPLDFDESLVGDDSGIEALTAEFSNQSLTSPLPPIISGSPAPISPMRVPQTPPFGTFQRALPFVGSNNPAQYGALPPPYRSFLQGEQSDPRGLESPLQQTPQLQGQVFSPAQFMERSPMPPVFPYEQSADGENMRPTFEEYRQPQFFPTPAVNYSGFSGEGVPPVIPDIAGSVGLAYSPTTPDERDKEQSRQSYQEDIQEDQSRKQEVQA